MSEKSDMTKAKKLIQAKRYDEAITLLATIDHPTADKWRERVESIIVAQARQKDETISKRAAMMSFVYFFSCFLIFLICVVVIPLTSN